VHGAFLRAPTELVYSRRPGSSVVVNRSDRGGGLILRRAIAPSQRTKN
jgi:hypothetical protein